MTDQSDASPIVAAADAGANSVTTISLKRAPWRKPAADSDAPAATGVEPAPAALHETRGDTVLVLAPEPPVSNDANVAPERAAEAPATAAGSRDASSGVGSSATAWRARILASIPQVSPVRAGVYACGVAAALAAGWSGASLLTSSQRTSAASVAFAAQTDARVERLADEVRALRDSIAALSKAGRPRGGDDLKPVNDRLASLSETIDRFRLDQGGKIGVANGALDRIEKMDRDMSARVAQMGERLERIERQSAPVTTGSIPAPAAQATAQAIPNPPPRPEAAPDKPNMTTVEQRPQQKPIEGWALRDIYDGVALIENRRAGLLEVSPGQMVRGLGRIEKIERRGGRWVVVTDQGVISAN